jgi:hypothetical protein
VSRDKRIGHGRGMDDAQPFDTLRAQFRIARRGLVRSPPADALRMMRGQATRQAIVGRRVSCSASAVILRPKWTISPPWRG